MLTQTSKLAIRTLLLVGWEGGGKPIGARELAERTHCSSSYLGKILGVLVKDGILNSSRGPNGGVTLARNPEEISFLSIVESCQGQVAPRCVSEKHGGVTISLCPFHEVMREVYAATAEALNAWTLSDLMRREICSASCEDYPALDATCWDCEHGTTSESTGYPHHEISSKISKQYTHETKRNAATKHQGIVI